MGRTYKGHVPKLNYKYITSIGKWDMYADSISNLNFINWKIILAKGRSKRKANYWLVFSKRLNRLVKSKELERFPEQIHPNYIKIIENISKAYFKENKQEVLPDLGEGTSPRSLPLLFDFSIKGTCKFVNGRKWRVGYDETNRFVVWEYNKKTDTPLYFSFDDCMAGLPLYDSVEIIYSIDSDESFFTFGESGKRVFLKYFLPEHFKYIKPFSQYLFYKLKENGLIK